MDDTQNYDYQDTVKIENGGLQRNLILFKDGTCVDVSDVRLAFPLDTLTEHISLLDYEGKELLYVHSLSQLDDESASVLKDEIMVRYYIPEVSKITSLRREYGFIKINAVVDHQERDISVKMSDDLCYVQEEHLIIKDSFNMRYSLPYFRSRFKKYRQTLESLV